MEYPAANDDVGWWMTSVKLVFIVFQNENVFFFSQNEVTFGDRWTVVHLFFYLFVDGDFR